MSKISDLIYYLQSLASDFENIDDEQLKADIQSSFSKVECCVEDIESDLQIVQCTIDDIIK